MITTISLASIHHLIYNKKKNTRNTKIDTIKKKESQFFVMITLRVYSLNIHIYHTAVLTVIIMLYITSVSTYLSYS